MHQTRKSAASHQLCATTVQHQLLEPRGALRLAAVNNERSDATDREDRPKPCWHFCITTYATMQRPTQVSRVSTGPKNRKTKTINKTTKTIQYKTLQTRHADSKDADSKDEQAEPHQGGGARGGSHGLSCKRGTFCP